MELTVPNALTLFRFALVPVFAWIFFSDGPVFALSIFLTASITDILDGYIARRTNKITTFGKWADPLADKIMTITVLICLTIARHLPWYFLAFYSAKETLMVIGAAISYRGKDREKFNGSKKIGKAAMVATFIGLTASFFKEQIDPWHIVMMWIGTALSIAAFIYYYSHHYRKKMRG